MFPVFFFSLFTFPRLEMFMHLLPLYFVLSVSTHSVFFVILNQIFGGEFKLLRLLLCNFISFPLRFKTPPPKLHFQSLFFFNVHGSVHRNNILIYIQQDATLHSLFYLETALHVSGGTSAHHQDSIQPL